MVTMGLCDEEKSIDEPEVSRQRCDNRINTPLLAEAEFLV
jgi:hypothetical protein